MGHLTKEEIQQIQIALEQSGLTYAQLQEELLDHLICDIEMHMQQGLSFQQAWQKVNESIPNNQFKNIQNETMELLSKKIEIGVIKFMTIVSFFLLVAATVFKLLHLQGTDMLLLSAFVMGASTILVASLKGFYISSNKKGRYLVLLLGLLIVIFITSIVFQVLHWPGAVPLRFVSVIGLTLLFPAVSIYFFRKKQATKNHPLILLAEENRVIIDRVVLALVSLGVVFKLPVLLRTSPYNFAPTLFLILAIFITGLYIFTFTWKPYVSTLPEKNHNALSYLLITSIIAFALFMLSGMHRIFSDNVSMIMALIFYILLAAIVLTYYLYYSQDNQRNLLALFSFLVLLIPLLRLGVDMGILSGSPAELISTGIYNVGVLFGLILLLIIFYRKPVFRAFMLLMLAHYTLTYPVV